MLPMVIIQLHFTAESGVKHKQNQK